LDAWQSPYLLPVTAALVFGSCEVLVAKQDDEVRRRIAFRSATWHALACLALESGRDVHQLAEEAFADLLKKHRRPATLREALRESVRMLPANDHRPPAPRRAR
jgi:hypothetical protein